MPSEIGIKIDNRYEVLSELGRGGMGVVYKATDLRLDRLVAIKVMTAHIAGRDESIERFLREAKSIAKMQHSNIVVVHDYGYHGEAPYIAMEYVEGMALDKLIASRVHLSLLTKVHYMIQVCQALHYAHQCNIVHRDVKPGNIMVLESGSRVKLLDFGIARAGTASSLSRSGLAMGTTCYMSPEQTKGHKDLDARSDMFSAGIVLYELLTGSPPWPGEGDYEIMTRIINDPFPPLSTKLRNYPAGLDRVLERALAKDPATRYQTAERMAADLAELETPLKEQVLEDALVQFEQGELLRARDLVSQILRVDTRHREALELNQKLQQIAQLQQRGERVQQLRQAAEQAIGQKQYQEALTAIEQAIAIDSANSELFHYRDLIRQELKCREDIRKKLELARKAHEINDLSSAQELVEKALEQENQNQQLQEYYEEATRALAARAFPQAKRWILEIEAVDPQFPQLASLRKTLADAETEGKRQIEVENLVSTIRQILKAGDVAQVLQATEAALVKFPGEVRLVRLQKQAEELRNATQRERAIQEQIASITTLAQQGKISDALAVAENALQRSGGDQRFQAAVTQLRQSMEREKLARVHQEIMARARDAMRAADYETAVQILTPARIDFPASKEIAETLRSAQEALAQKAADRLGENARKRQVTDALERALAAEPAPEVQVRLAEDAARSIPGNELVEQVLLRVRQRQQQISSAMESARIAERGQNYAEAIRAWERIRQLYPQYPELEAQILRLKRALQPPEPAKPSPPKPVAEPAATARDFSATSIMAAAKPAMKMEAPVPASVAAPDPAAKSAPVAVPASTPKPAPIIEAQSAPVVEPSTPGTESPIAPPKTTSVLSPKFLWTGIGLAVVMVAGLAYVVFGPKKDRVSVPGPRQTIAETHPATVPVPKTTEQPSPQLPKPEMGKLSIQTNVDQVDVLVDGVPKTVTKGKSVTFSFFTGEHKIGVDKRGYTAPVQIVNLVKDGTAKLHFNLIPSAVSEQPLGDPRLYIMSTPGASIRIDNNFPGEVPSDGNFTAKLTPGPHDLEVTKNGYETWSQKIKVKAGDSITYEAILKGKPVSIIKFLATPNNVQLGDAVELQWDTKNAAEVDIQPDIGRVNPADSRNVHPTGNTIYILTAKGTDGVTVQQRSPITVIKPLPPVASFTGPARIQEGGSAKLSWDTQNAVQTYIDPPISCSVGPSGECDVSPKTTTTYFLKARNAGGETIKKVEVKVDPVPKVVAGPSVPSPPPENPDAKAINETMAEYKNAFHFMDIDALKHIWPTMPGATDKDIRKLFNAKDIKAVDVQLTCKDPMFKADAAEYACQELFTYRYENTKQQLRFSAIFDLKKIDGKWKILDKRDK